MNRYFVDDVINDDIYRMDGDNFHHFHHVLRGKEEDKIEIVSLDNKLYLAKARLVTSDFVDFQILEELNSNVELPVDVTVVVSPLKSDRTDWMMQKITELGVSEVIFTNFKRSVVSWKSNVVEKKLERLKKIAKAASQQSHRLKIPTIQYMSFNDIKLADYDVKLVAWEESAKEGEKSQLHKSLTDLPAGSKIIIYIGPEGGITEEEILDLENKEFKKVGLGPRILRAETAPIFFLSSVSTIIELGR